MKNIRLLNTSEKVILTFYLLPKEMQDEIVNEILKGEYKKNEKH